jgi:hypothetical protein
LGKIDRLAAGFRRVFDPAVSDKLHVADRGPGQCRPVIPIDGDRLLEQSQSPEYPFSRYRKEDRKRAQVEI